MNNKNTQEFATGIGAISLIIWAFSALIITYLNDIPIFELMGIVLTCAFILTVIKVTYSGQWSVIFKQPLLFWFIGIAGIFGNDYAYYQAFHFAPAAQVDLITYLWPIMAAICTSFLPRERFSVWHLIGALVSFSGIYLLLTGDPQSFEVMSTVHIKGYLWAFFAAIVWTGFVVGSRFFARAPVEMAGIFCGVGAVIAFSLHAGSSPWVIPNFKQTALIAIIGFISTGVTLYCWSYGIKKGNFRVLTVLSYLTSILSVAVLVLFGRAEFSFVLLISSCMVALGCWVTSEPEQLEKLINGFRYANGSVG